jgi:pyruvate/2-oxoglutarate dehydrogenase complex dihydrolipoamide acyltransferase (E2) component
VILPKLDRIMTEGTIQQWLKKTGDNVIKGEPIALIETEKVSVELESPESGKLATKVEQGSSVPVGDVVAVILSPGESYDPTDLEGDRANSKPTRVSSLDESERPQQPRLTASPSARRVAKTLGVDLSEVKDTRFKGRIVAKDVEDYAKAKLTVSASATVVDESSANRTREIELKGWRKVMSEKMIESVRSAAQVTTVAEVDATELIAVKSKLESMEHLKDHLTITCLIAKAVGLALKENELINSTLVNDKIILHEEANIGIAVAIESGGLVVPVIRRVNSKSLSTISAELAALSDKARNNSLTLEDVSGGTFTITNPGMMGVVLDTPLIVSPQSAILGIGSISKRPVVLGEHIAVRSMMYLSLTYDHRIIAGHEAIAFVRKVKNLIENPIEIVLAGKEL